MLCVNSLVAIGYVVIMVSLKTLKIVRNPIFRYLTYMAAILKKSNSSLNNTYIQFRIGMQPFYNLMKYFCS